MAYQDGTGTVLNPQDLLAVLNTFLAAQGWTIHQAIDDWNSGTEYVLTVSRHGVAPFYTFQGRNNSHADLNVRMHLTYTPGAHAWNQPDGPPTATLSNYCGGPFVKYYFFEGDDYIHIVIEKAAKYFTHIGCGTLEKSGVYDGGEYTYGVSLYSANQTNPDYSVHRYPFDSANSYEGLNNGASHYQPSYVRFNEGGHQWHVFGDIEDSYGTRTTRPQANGYPRATEGFLYDMYWRLTNTYNGITCMMPITVVVRRIDGSNTYCIAGCPKSIRACLMTNLLPGQSLMLGTDEWMVFPIVGYGTSGQASGSYAMAFKKEV